MAEKVGAERNRIFDVCLLIVKSREDAEDLASATMLNAVAKLDSFQGKSALYTWLYRIAINLCKNHIKKISSQRSQLQTVSMDQPREIPIPEEMYFYDLLPDDAWSTDPSVQLERQETREALIRAIMLEGSLKNHGAEFLVAFHYHGMTYDEIATQFGTTPQAVKSELFRTRKRMRLYLASQFENGEL